MPRLELQAALMASRSKVTIFDQMDTALDSVFLWSDSKTVLNYLQYAKTNFGPYIMQRCNKIPVNILTFCHVSSHSTNLTPGCGWKGLMNYLTNDLMN